MIDRINLILKAKNITARQFAEEIGIQPSGMSHILGGRNNPSLDFVTKVIRRYPEIDANWLLLGRGAMLVGSPSAPVEESHSPALVQNDDIRPETIDKDEPLLFPEIEEQESVDTPATTPYQESPDLPAAPKAGEPPTYVPTYMAVPPDSEPTPTMTKTNDGSRRLVKLLFIYSDNTFEECLPTAEARQ